SAAATGEPRGDVQIVAGRNGAAVAAGATRARGGSLVLRLGLHERLDARQVRVLENLLTRIAAWIPIRSLAEHLATGADRPSGGSPARGSRGGSSATVPRDAAAQGAAPSPEPSASASSATRVP